MPKPDSHLPKCQNQPLIYLNAKTSHSFTKMPKPDSHLPKCQNQPPVTCMSKLVYPSSIVHLFLPGTISRCTPVPLLLSSYSSIKPQYSSSSSSIHQQDRKSTH